MTICGVLVAGALAACGSDATDATDTTDASAPIIDAGPRIDAENCQPPDMLLVLDRTMSMHRQPDGEPAPQNAHELSKWWIAIDVIETLTAELDETIRFGLELFPRDPGGGLCVTLSERIAGTVASNESCEAGEVVVQPDIDTAGAIAAAIDPETTLLCGSTPIADGLQTAIETFGPAPDQVRERYVVLISDGGDTCGEDDAIGKVQTLNAAGIKTYVIGFDGGTGETGGVDPLLLNNLACAGRTAPDPVTNCVDDGAGNFTAVAPDGPALYLAADDAAALRTQLEELAGEVCCDCVL